MSAEPNSELPPAAQQRQELAMIEWRQRSDLVILSQDSGHWIIKDPLALTYAMLSEKEMAVLRHLDGSTTWGSLRGRLDSAWPDQKFTFNDVEDCLNQLIQQQLVVRTTSNRLSTFVTTPAAPRPRFRLGSILRFQIPLINPGPWLSRIEPFIHRLFSRRSAILLAAITLIAAIMVTIRFDQLTENLPGPWDFFGPDNVLLLLASFITVKALHETAHAFAARRFGAECNEAGVMLMMFTPLLYTNVSDAWTLDRRSRMMITAAGMLVELALASVATIFWFIAAPGLAKSILTNVMILCTVGTFAFNANPLLRFDGYFLLTDLIGLPNLSQRASDSLHQFFSSVLLGRTVKHRENEPRFVMLYAVCSGLYRASLSITIVLMLYHFFDLWNLRFLGVILAILATLSMIVLPLASFFSQMLVEILHQKTKGLLLLRAGCLMALTTCGLFIPFPCSVVVPCVVEPAGRPVFATISGELQSATKYGNQVSPGDALAILSDSGLYRQLTRLRGEVKVLQSRVRAYELDRTGTQSALLPETRKLLESAVRRAEQFDAELKRLSANSTTNGVLLPPRATAKPEDQSSLRAWHHRPLDPDNVGAFIEEGTLLGLVGDPSTFELILPITSSERELIRVNQKAVFQPTGNPEARYRGSVLQTPGLPSDEIPQELTVAGLVPPLSAAKPGEDVRRWQVICRISVPDETTSPRQFSTGSVRITVEPASLLTRISRFMNSVLD